tara:strand:+ start:3125 stop:3532 length:408 start_codon:yes stop_codon:yes gene_type:complete
MPHSNYDTEVKAFRKFCKREIEVLKLDRITISDNCNAKLNIRIQKFFIYSHNLDLENALKYHQKLTDSGAEMLETFVNLGQNGNSFSLVGSNHKNNEGVLENDSNGYVQFADLLKDNYELREEIIDNVKTLIANM